MKTMPSNSVFVRNYDSQINVVDLGSIGATHPTVQTTYHFDQTHKYLTCAVASLDVGRFAIGVTDYLFTRGHRGTFEAIRQVTSGEMSLLYGGELLVRPSIEGNVLLHANGTSGFLHKFAGEYFLNVQNDVGILRELMVYMEPYINMTSQTRFTSYDESRVHLDDHFNGVGTNVRHNLLEFLGFFPDLTSSKSVRDPDIQIRVQYAEPMFGPHIDSTQRKMAACIYALRCFVQYGQRWDIINGRDIFWWNQLIKDLGVFKLQMGTADGIAKALRELLDLDEDEIKQHIFYRMKQAVNFLNSHTTQDRDHRYDVFLLEP